MANINFHLILPIIKTVLKKIFDNLKPSGLPKQWSVRIAIEVIIVTLTLAMTSYQHAVLKAEGDDSSNESSFMDYVNYWYGTYLGGTTTTTSSRPSFIARFAFNMIFAHLVSFIVLQFASLTHSGDKFLLEENLLAKPQTSYYGRYSKTPYKSSYQPSYRY